MSEIRWPEAKLLERGVRKAAFKRYKYSRGVLGKTDQVDSVVEALSQSASSSQGLNMDSLASTGSTQAT
eukprot:9272458-Lingulodinium_polyedra.AAC.1